jgi:hypothetical protein
MVDYDECVKEALEYLLELSKSEGGLNLDPRYVIPFPESLILLRFLWQKDHVC